MGYQYLNNLVREENLQRFLELADVAAGVGSSVDSAFELQMRLRNSKPMQLCIKRLNADPASAALIASRHVAPPYDPEALRAMPRGSLGHTYATVLAVMGHDLNFFPKPAYWNNFETDADYINYRLASAHDLHHILTGFSPNRGGGEVGVLSFDLAQTSHPALAAVDLVSLMMAWVHGDTPLAELDDPAQKANTAASFYRSISTGMEMGIAAKPLFPVLWEERMEQDLEELRHELEIDALREGVASWHTNPAIQAALAS